MESSHLLERSAIEGTYAPGSLKWAQLEPGAFEVRYKVLEAAPVEVSMRSINVGFSSEAQIAPHKLAIGLIADKTTNARWFGIGVDERDIAVSADTMEMSTEGPSSFYDISLDARAIARDFSGAPDAIELIAGVRSPALARDPIQAARLRTWIRWLFFRSGESVGTLRKGFSLESVYGTLIPLLASAVEQVDAHRVEPSKCLTRRLAAVRACETYMRDHVDATVTLLHLSQVSGMRSRSLINAFEAVTGFSPMDYLKRLRLSGVHRTLRSSDKGKTRIIDVATEWGFWHMGHFTADYRTMFGETPSRTLLDP
jgi:AraC family transcriptional regulator, ethanolamine operon transcriptional activator